MDVYMVRNCNTGAISAFKNFESAMGAVCWVTGQENTPELRAKVGCDLAIKNRHLVTAATPLYTNMEIHMSEVYREFK